MTEVTLSAYQDQIDYMVEEARYLEAFAHLRHILKQYPRYVDAYYLLGKMMLEAALPNLAIDMFRRVLNAQPEHLLARIGLGLAHEHLGNSKAALWNLERAFELDPGNEELAGELRRLYAQQGGVMPDHLSLTRAGLARLYLRGDLYGRAAEEFQAMLEKEPLRVDLRVALAEAYWRDDQIVQAADVCQQTLTDFPYSLKANLLLGTLWLKSGQEEGERYLQRAREIDPQNDLATQLFGSASLMEPKAVNIERLSYDPQAISVDREEEWFKHLEAASVSTSVSEALPDMTETEMRLVDITAGLESQIEIPDWLRDLGPLDEDEEVPAWFQEEDLETEEVSSWLKETGVEEAEGAEALPSWFEDVEAEGLEEEAVPDWFRDLAPEEAEIDIEAAFAEETAPEGELVEGELPEWLQGAQPPAGRLATEEIEEELEEEGVPEWLQELRPPEMEAEEETLLEETLPEETLPEETLPEETLLEETLPEETLPEETLLEEEAEAPEWLQEHRPPVGVEDEGMPDWLQDLQPSEMGGEGAEDRGTVTQEAESMFGWTSFAEDVTEEVEPAAVEEEEMFGWTSFDEAGAAAAEEEEDIPAWLQEMEASATIEEEEEEGIPDWLQELEPPAALREEEELPEWLAEEEEPVTAEEEEEELPDWLAQQETPITTEEEGIPDWLQELEPPAALREEEELPEWLAEEEEPVTAEEEEGIPDWLAQQETPAAVAEEPVEEAPAAPDFEGEMLSGDDALAWLESLTAGKEDELRAQAEAEAKVRVDEIMGRKPRVPAAEAPEEVVEELPEPVEEEPVEEAPVAAAPAAPDFEGEMLSGDDALAWLESLTAGKEDELRAQVEAEAKVRVDEIMGRKPRVPAAEAPEEVVEELPEPVEEEPVEEEPVEEAPVAAAPAAPDFEGEMLSGDDALAWLESLTAGKEDELRAQVEAEAKVRVDEIMGRKPRVPAVEAPEEVVEELPEPVEEEPVEEAPVAEAPEEVVEELPVAEVEEEPEVVGGELLTEEEAATTAVQAAAGEDKAFFGWSGFDADIAEAETLPEPEVVEPEEEIITSFGFTRFTEREIEREEEEEVAEEPVRSKRTPASEPQAEKAAAAPEPDLEEEELEAVSDITAFMESKAAEEEPAPAEEEPVPEKETGPALPEVPEVDLEELRAQVKKNKSDYKARLTLARALWKSREIDAAVAQYTRLIRADEFMEQVIDDLQAYSAERPNDPRPLRALGDAYMKQGLLDQALDTYKQAMDLL